MVKYWRVDTKLSQAVQNESNVVVTLRSNAQQSKKHRLMSNTRVVRGPSLKNPLNKHQKPTVDKNSKCLHPPLPFLSMRLSPKFIPLPSFSYINLKQRNIQKKIVVKIRDHLHQRRLPRHELVEPFDLSSSSLPQTP